MGGGYYDYDSYTSRVASSRSSGKSMFTHTTAINTGKASKKVHEKLDPSKLNKAGKNVRESFDSPDHPNSRAVAVMFDVTGSMQMVPQVFIEKLDKLMSGLVKKGYLKDPHILFGSIGDAKSDHVPLQVGQFESSNEMDEVLSLIFLEGNGGGQNKESYELAMYYMARHTEMDCLNKRGEKGYLFLLGDEFPYKQVSKNEVKEIIGENIQEDIPLKDILDELREKFEVFWILPNGTSYYNDRQTNDFYKETFGERFLKLEDPNDVCELIISAIALNEGYSLNKIKDDLKDLNISTSSITNSCTALDAFANTVSADKGMVKKGKLPKKVNKKDALETI